MRLLALLICLVLSNFAQSEISLRWFNVPVGHYNPLMRMFFDLRYYVNDEFYVPGGPIFIYIGGDAEVYSDFIENGAMHEIAEETGGYLFALEHRYFGESKPMPNTSVGNLGFLTIHQAIADIGEFVAFVKGNFPEAVNARVILWGRGYGGALAVWARHKFQHLVDGVWASSAPINGILESQEFMRNTGETIRSLGGPECYQTLEDAFRLMEDLVRLRNTAYIEDRFRLCSRIDTDIDDDVSRFFYGIASDIGYQFVSYAEPSDIEEKCSLMGGLNSQENPPENAIDAFARWFVDDFHENSSCLNYNNTAVLEMYQNIEWNSVSTINGHRQALWLQCAQLGQFATSNNGEGHPFGSRFDLSFFRKWCTDVFQDSR